MVREEVWVALFVGVFPMFFQGSYELIRALLYAHKSFIKGINIGFLGLLRVFRNAQVSSKEPCLFENGVVLHVCYLGDHLAVPLVQEVYELWR